MAVAWIHSFRVPAAMAAWLLALTGTEVCFAEDVTMAELKVLVDFSEPAEKARWRVVNDGVMGGLSQSGMAIADDIGVAVFQGTLSLENNGGFASVRRTPHEYAMSGYDGIELRVKGDGRTYQFRIRTNDRYDGVSYRSEFETVKGEWVTVRLPFSSFVPTFRGRRVPDAPALDPASIRQIGFLIADKRQEDFRIEVNRIAAYRTMPARQD